MMIASGKKVCRYFDSKAESFDAIYQQDKSLVQKVIDRLFHRVIYQRFQLTFELCGEVAGKRVLDIGCGSGRYAVEFARRGAEVIGLDFAPAMVEMARQRAVAAGVGERCCFVNGDFLDWREPHRFDICLAIGFFDYVETPGDVIEKIHLITEDQAVLSFPIRWTLRSLTRWMRLNLNRCPVYFYDETQVAQLLETTGWNSFAFHRLSRDYLVHGQKREVYTGVM